jgi:hypothetical protein
VADDFNVRELLDDVLVAREKDPDIVSKAQCAREGG